MGLGQNEENEENDDLLDRCTMTDLHFSFLRPPPTDSDRNSVKLTTFAIGFLHTSPLSG